MKVEHKRGEGMVSTLGLANQKVKPGDLVCIIFGCSVPVILRRGEPKAAVDVEAERFEDGLQSFKACLSKCEQACFRRVKYHQLQERAQKEGNLDLKDLELEIKEETEAVNIQLSDWRREKEEAQQKRKRDDEAKERRKQAAMERIQLRRTKTLEKRQTLGPAATNISLQDAEGETQARNVENEREREKKETRQKDPFCHYTFLGEAYVHGMMDGEAVRQHIIEGLPERLFEIR
jgi:hypothetical protein